MEKTKLGISVSNRYGVTYAEQVELLARIGFDAVSPTWQKDGSHGGRAGRQVEVGKSALPRATW